MLTLLAPLLRTMSQLLLVILNYFGVDARKQPVVAGHAFLESVRRTVCGDSSKLMTRLQEMTRLQKKIAGIHKMVELQRIS
uniref:Putative secreted protein n=1 Tax=Ixodes ricinus TaxID=34613 RepID=A0A6B0U1T7_IXORI